MNNILLLGPPGSGKGTQADFIVSELGYLHLSTGNLIRNNIYHNTNVGQECKKYIDSGQLVPDDLMIQIVEDHLKNLPKNANIVWDGFPRTIIQAQKLDELFIKLNSSFNNVFYFEISESEIYNRLTGRWVCPVCGATYHIKNKLPLKTGICDKDQEYLIQRSDDKIDRIKTRLGVYYNETKPLLNYYLAQHKLISINAELDNIAISQKIKKVIDK